MDDDTEPTGDIDCGGRGTEDVDGFRTIFINDGISEDLTRGCDSFSRNWTNA